jgi:UDP-GlcNAc3NAcA epimerase
MQTKKILSILGARPQFIKAAVLSGIIAEKGEIQEVIVHTGQHFDANMSEVFFEEMGIPVPKYNLGISGLSHGAMTGRMLEKIEAILQEENPDMVVVYGDTNSTLAGALAASKMQIPVAHVEAGLRSFNMRMPEEVNRILTDRISQLLLCPTDTAVKNLQKEGFDDFGSRVVQTGDIMKDSVSLFSKRSDEKSTVLDDHNLTTGEFVLATVHRQENTESKQKMDDIIQGLNKICAHSTVVLPLHPRTRKSLEGLTEFKGLLIDPVGYLDMLSLLKHCTLVCTDSGGLQKEAYFNDKNVVVLREETEWVELVEKGYAKLVGSDAEKIFSAFNELQGGIKGGKSNLYGEGAGIKIYRAIAITWGCKHP